MFWKTLLKVIVIVFLMPFLLPAPSVYAVSDSVTLHFDPNGADNADRWQKGDVVLTYENPKNVRTVILWYKENYILSSWNTKANGSGDKYTIRFSDKNIYTPEDFESDEVWLYARYTPGYARIRYDGNGATGGEMDDEYVLFNEDHIVKWNVFEKTGHIFTGWRYKDKVVHPDEMISGFQSTIHGTSDKSFVTGLNSPWYSQGAVIFNKNGKKSVVSAFVNEKGDEDQQCLLLWDYETGECLIKKYFTDLGHCNDMAYDPKKNKIYTSYDAGDKFLHIAELDTDLNLVKSIQMYYKDPITKESIPVNGGVSKLSYYNGYYYIGAGRRLYKFDENFEIVPTESGGTAKSLENKELYADFNNMAIPSYQGSYIKDGWMYAPFFIGSACNSYFTVTNLNDTKESYFFPYSPGDMTYKENRFEVEDLYMDNDRIYFFTTKATNNDLGRYKSGDQTVDPSDLYVQTAEGDGIFNNELKAQWELVLPDGWYTLSPGTAGNTKKEKSIRIKRAKVSTKSDNRTFFFKRQDDGTYMILKAADKGRVRIFSAYGEDRVVRESDKAQRWKIVYDREGSYFLVNVKTDRTFDDTGLFGFMRLPSGGSRGTV